MKKKLLLIFLTLVSALCLALALTSCDSPTTSTSQGSGTNSSVSDGSSGDDGSSDGSSNDGSSSDDGSGDDSSGDDSSGDDSSGDDSSGDDGSSDDGSGDDGTSDDSSGDDGSGDDSSGDDSSGDDSPQNTPTEGLQYTLNYDEAYYLVTGIGTATDTDIVIPTTYQDKPVSAIESYAFDSCATIESITIPESITSLGKYAFKDCTALTKINFNATALNDLYKNSSVFYKAGQSGSGITVNIGANVTKIPNYLFYSDYSSNSPKITSVVFADDSVCQSIGDGAFYYCSSLTSINIPEDVTSIGEKAFTSCSSLTSINIPEGVTEIAFSAFTSCSSLTSITIPESVTSIGNYAFKNCTALTTINFNATAVRDLTSSGNHSFYNAGQSGSGIAVNIGANVTKIPAYLFNPDSSLSSSYIPKITSVVFAENSVCQSIGKYAFRDCRNLQTVTFGANSQLTSIGKYAFEYCISLTSVNLPDGVSSIGENAFASCNILASVTIPTALTSLGEGAFDYCRGLTEINYNATAINDLSEDYDVFYYAGKDGSGIAVNIGANVTQIPAYLFQGGSGGAKITSVVFADNSLCQTIGAHAFYDCQSNLQTLTFGANSQLTSVGAYAFYGCTELTALTLPETITSIGEYAFSSCRKLTSLTIPKSVTSIGTYAFSGYRSLTEINFNATAMNDLAENNYVFSYAGKDGSGITVNIGANVTKIPAYLFCPYLDDKSYVPQITSVVFAEDSVCQTIGEGAFRRCIALTSVVIPKSVVCVAPKAFLYCGAIESITFENTSGWYVTEDATATSGTEVTVTDATKNVDVLFDGGYGSYYWKRNVES